MKTEAIGLTNKISHDHSMVHRHRLNEYNLHQEQERFMARLWYTSIVEFQLPTIKSAPLYNVEISFQCKDDSEDNKTFRVCSFMSFVYPFSVFSKMDTQN